MNSNDWDIKILQSWEDIWGTAFQNSWHNLMEQSNDAHVFFHPVLVKVWVETYLSLRDIRPLFVHGLKGAQEVIFPLILWRRNWKNGFLRTIVPAGHSDFDYHDPLFLHTPSRETVDEFYALLLLQLDKHCSFDRIHLDGIHNAYIPKYGKVVGKEGCLSWQLDHRLAGDALVLPPKKKLANDIKRRLRRLEENGTLTLSRYDGDEEHLHQTIDHMLKCHSIRWPRAYKAPDFHFKLISAGHKAGVVDFVTVSFNGKPVAWRICFIYKERISDYMPAFDADYHKYSVGYATIGYALQGALSDHINIVDHLRGNEDYKNVWGGEKTTIYDVVYDNDSSSSRRIRLFTYRALRAANSFFR